MNKNSTFIPVFTVDFAMGWLCLLYYVDFIYVLDCLCKLYDPKHLLLFCTEMNNSKITWTFLSYKCPLLYALDMFQEKRSID